jgi:hypothetical protein
MSNDFNQSWLYKKGKNEYFKLKYYSLIKILGF